MHVVVMLKCVRIQMNLDGATLKTRMMMIRIDSIHICKLDYGQGILQVQINGDIRFV